VNIASIQMRPFLKPHTIWWDSRTRHISMPNIGKRKICKDTW